MVSVIIPVFNAEKYLRECLDSIKNQEADFEAILVDDGSTDTSGKICDEYAINDTRFRVIHCPNGGPAYARNIGLEKASGEWITFVDADDLIEPGYLSIPTNTITSDVIFVNFVFLEGCSIEHTDESNYTSETITDASELLKIKYQAFDTFSRQPYRKAGYTWGKFYRGCIIRERDIKFPKDLWYYEDATFFWRFMDYAKKVHFIQGNTPHYIYRNNPDSLTQIKSTEAVLKRKIPLYWVDKNLYTQQSKEAFNRFYIDQFMLLAKLISRGATNLLGWYRAIRTLYIWEPFSRFLKQNYFLVKKEIGPAYKAYFLIKTRLIYPYYFRLYCKSRKFSKNW